MSVIKELTIDNFIIKDKLFVKNQNAYLENVIQSVNWTCKLIDEETLVEESFSGSTYFQIPENEFIKYEELTKKTVLSWLEDHPDIEYRMSIIIDRFNQRVKDASNIKRIKVDFNSLPDE